MLMPLSPSFGQSGPSDPDAIDYSALNNTVYTFASLPAAFGKRCFDPAFLFRV